MRKSMIIAVVAPLLAAVAVQADEPWEFNHEYVLDGCARVYDGGPEECIFLDFDGPVLGHNAGVFDSTRPGTLGALSYVIARTDLDFIDESLVVSVSYSANHLASLFPGGDTPGGEAQGSLLSVIEFVMPADEMEWSYSSRITIWSGFEGSAVVTVDNVTQSETLLTLIDASYENSETMSLAGSAGDLIRITSEMSGGGSIPPGVMTIGTYNPSVGMTFTIVPEPTTLSTLFILSLPLLTRRRASPNSAPLRKQRE